MNSDFMKFPTTPHLLWLGTSLAREDKVLSKTEALAFLESPVIVEEKVDGANLGFSFDSHGTLRAQNRGSFLGNGTKGQFAPLWSWLARRESQLFDVLEDRMIVFGEWCYARHSIYYTRLPDFFLAFDVFDKTERHFLNVDRRDLILRDLKLAGAPRLAGGSFTLASIVKLIGNSALYDGPMEGIYLRQEHSPALTGRAKIVRPEFVQEIGEHWSKKPLVPNQLCPSACAPETKNSVRGRHTEGKKRGREQ